MGEKKINYKQTEENYISVKELAFFNFFSLKKNTMKHKTDETKKKQANYL